MGWQPYYKAPFNNSCYSLLAPAGRRPGAVRPVPALLSAARGPAQVVLCAPVSRWRGAAGQLRALRSFAWTDRGKSHSTTSARQRGAVAGTAGCNLACKFCQNWDMSKSREMDTLADRAMPGTWRRQPGDGVPQRGLHLQRPDNLLGMPGRGRRLPSRTSPPSR